VLALVVGIGLSACGALISGRGDAPPGARTLHVVIHNAVERDLVLAFDGTGTAGFTQVGESLVAPCAVSVFAFALSAEWRLRLDDLPVLASGEQPEVYLQAPAPPDFTVVVRVDDGGFHYDRLRAGVPTAAERPGPVGDCP
jgi:hypothetical protein